MTFFNTTNETGAELATYKTKATTQSDRIYEFYKRHRGVPFSPSQVQAALAMHNVPITSIRRAITDLTNECKLIKTEIKTQGMYGRDEYCWRLAGRMTQGELRL